MYLLSRARRRANEARVTIWSKYLTDVIFVHINKTGGSSIEAGLGLPFQHRTASEFISLIGEHRWNRCFTFSFVRNPWSKVASHYRYRVATNQTGMGVSPIPFREWVRAAYRDHDARYFDQPKMFMPQTAWLTRPDGVNAVDFVGRFEQLEQDYEQVRRHIGRGADLPHQKRTSPAGSREWVEMYDEESIEIVGTCFDDDVRRFGYRFP